SSATPPTASTGGTWAAGRRTSPAASSPTASAPTPPPASTRPSRSASSPRCDKTPPGRSTPTPFASGSTRPRMPSTPDHPSTRGPRRPYRRGGLLLSREISDEQRQRHLLLRPGQAGLGPRPHPPAPVGLHRRRDGGVPRAGKGHRRAGLDGASDGR